MSRGPAAGDEGQDKSLSEDYYAVLNVSREASAEELKASFRRLCVLYHPDKHQREDLKAAALAIFPRVQKAYAVLSDEQQRAVYDMYGVAGLEAGRELAPYHNHAGEMRAEYAMRRREQEHAQELAAASPQGRMSVTIDAAPLFRPVDTEYDEYEDAPSSWEEVRVAQMSIRQAVRAQLTDQTTVLLDGVIMTENGGGGGNLSTTVRHQFSSAWQADATLGIGSVRFVSLKAQRTFDGASYFFAKLAFRQARRGIALGLTAGVSRQFTKSLHGFLRWDLGSSNSMNTSVYYVEDRTSVSGTLQLGLAESFLGVTYTREVGEATKVRLDARVGVPGLYTLSYGMEGDLGEGKRLGVTISCSTVEGVAVRVKFVRAQQEYVLPILLADEAELQPLLIGTLLTVGAVVLAQKLVLEPYRRHQEQQELAAKRRHYAALVAQRRREALAAVQLMAETVERKVEAERRHGGLIILEAWYGQLVAGTAAPVADEEARVVDVRVQLQCLTKDSVLRLVGSTKSNLMGFYDPCIDEPKQLKILYLFQGRRHEVTLDDADDVKLPLKSHCLER